MRLVGLILTFILVLSCGEKTKNQATTDVEIKTSSSPRASVKFPVYNFDELSALLHKDDDKTYIINFWATWCKPCVEELPAFERTYKELQQQNVALVLVSLDMPSMWKTKLEPFVEEHKLQGSVVILDDPKMNEWIPKLDPDWQGGIPATLIYNKNKRVFYPKGFTYDELNQELSKFL